MAAGSTTDAIGFGAGAARMSAVARDGVGMAYLAVVREGGHLLFRVEMS